MTPLHTMQFSRTTLKTILYYFSNKINVTTYFSFTITLFIKMQLKTLEKLSTEQFEPIILLLYADFSFNLHLSQTMQFESTWVDLTSAVACMGTNGKPPVTVPHNSGI